MCEGEKKDLVDELLIHFPRVRDTNQKNSTRLAALYAVEGCARAFISDCTPKEPQYINRIVSVAFESLPASVLSAIYSRVSLDCSKISYEEMERAVLDVYRTCPSVVLRMLEKDDISKRR